MLNRYLSLAVLVCIAASMVALGQNQGAEYLFQLPGTANSPQFVPYNALSNPLSPLANTSGPNGINGILAMPDGSKFYLIGSSAIQSVDPTFQNFHGINLTEPSGLTPTITAATLTPNGQYLLVGTLDSSNQSYLFLVNTGTDQAITGTGFPIQLGGLPGPYVIAQTAPCPSCWIAVSRDSKTAYVLENSVFGGPTQVVAYSLTTFLKIGSAATGPLVATGFQGAGSALTLSPQNVLYMAGNNLIVAIDPVTLLEIGPTIQLGGFNSSQLQFTPDGTTAYAFNQVPRGPGAAALMALNVASGTVSYWPPLNSTVGPQITSLFVAGNNNCPSGRCIFAYSSPTALGAATGTFYDVTPVTGGLSASVSQPSPTLAAAISLPGAPCPGAATVAGCILAATISNELPASNFLYVLIANGSQPYMDRISIGTDTISVTNGSPVLSGGIMQFVSVPVQGTAASFITFNNVQTVNNGNTSLPLIARAIGTTGLPVFNTAGTFSVDPKAGLVISNPNVTTGADGYVQSTVSVPAAGASCPNGVCAVTLTLGGATTTFSINVPGSGPTGGCGTSCPGGSSPQVLITSGQGQLIQQGNPAPLPLTVQITDATGAPIPNTPVSFAVTQGVGQINATSVLTDATGSASTNFFAETISTTGSFESDVIVATSSVGTATFFETAYAIPFRGGQALPGVQVSLNTPVPGQIIQVSPGAPASNAIQAFASTLPFNGFVSTPLPNVGIALQNTLGPTGGYDPTQPNPASCQNAPVSDATGTVTCTVVTSCSVAPGTYGITILVGGSFPFPGEVQIGKGGGGAVGIAVTSGNNQSGNAGQRAALPLIATLSDFCGNVVVGTAVTWQVTQGSATVQNTSTTSNVVGQVSNVLTFGQTPGQVTVKATITGGASVTFTLTNSIVVSAVTPVSGSGQTATVTQAFANPLVVAVTDSNHNPIAGVTVSFTVTSGAAGLNPTSAPTNASGQAQTSVTAGANPGTVVVTASVPGGFSTTFTLTAIPVGPTITATNFMNAGSSAPGLVPCGLAILVAPHIADGIQGVIPGQTQFGPFSYTVANFSMSINGVPAPIQAVSNQNGTQQVNFQTPCETQPGTATAAVSVNGVVTNVSGITVRVAQPGIFTYAGPNNLPYAPAYRLKDGSFVTPSNPLHEGETYFIVVTGLGQTSPPLITNSDGLATDQVVPQLILGVANNGIPIISATALPGSIGAYLITFQVPTPAQAGPGGPTYTGTNIPFSIGVIVNGNVTYSNNTYLASVVSN
jgi:hypothetical protein